MRRRLLYLFILQVVVILCITLTLLKHGSNEEKLQKSIENVNLKIIIYNRVPKSASTHLASTLLQFSKTTHQFRIIESAKNYPYQLTSTEQQQLKSKLKNEAMKSSNNRLIYSRHLYFVNFDSTPTIQFYYMNILRNPVERSVSHFDYQRSLCLQMRKRHENCTSMRPELVQLTMDECVSTGVPARCLSKSYGVRSMLSFFCGHDPVCNDTQGPPKSEMALTMAKSNVERHYLLVGLLEYLSNTLELLEFVAPEMFVNLPSYYKNFGSEIRAHRTNKMYRHTPSNETYDILRQILRPEYEFYEFIRKRFADQYLQAFNKNPTID